MESSLLRRWPLVAHEHEPSPCEASGNEKRTERLRERLSKQTTSAPASISLNYHILGVAFAFVY